MGTLDGTALQPPPLETAHRWVESQAGWLTFVTALLLAIGFVVLVREPGWTRIAGFLGVFAALFLICSIVMFTRPLGHDDADPTPLNAIFRFAYSFIFTTLTLGAVTVYSPELLFPTVDPVIVPKPAKQAEAGQRFQALLAILPGCDYNNMPEPDPTAIKTQRGSTTSTGAPSSSAPSSTGKSAQPSGSDQSSTAQTSYTPNPSIPAGAYCGDLPPQWVISIGGSILKCHYDGTCPQQEQPELDPDLEAKLGVLHRSVKDGRQKLADLENQIVQSRRRAAAGFVSSGGLEADLRLAYARQKDRVDALTEQEAARQGDLILLKKWKNPLLHIDGRPIVGGLIIPVYFVVLALAGALVSMMRKIPEFQQRVEPTYPAEFAQEADASEGPLPPISRATARDYVVFQILQVISAPAVAVIAYSYVRPNQMGTTAILAFAAGFSSEVFLLAIRAVVDRVIGMGPKPTRARAVAEVIKKSVATSELPPRGPESSGGLNLGDNVTLVKPVGLAMPGSRGVILSIEPGGELIVKLTQDQTGMPVAIRLQAAPPSSFQRTSDANQQPEGPAG